MVRLGEDRRCCGRWARHGDSDRDLFLPGGVRAVLGPGTRIRSFTHAHESPRGDDHPADYPGDRRGAGRLHRHPPPLADRTLAGAGLSGRTNTVELPASPIEWVLMALSGLVPIGGTVFRLSRLRGGYGNPKHTSAIPWLVRARWSRTSTMWTKPTPRSSSSRCGICPAGSPGHLTRAASTVR